MIVCHLLLDQIAPLIVASATVLATALLVTLTFTIIEVKTNGAQQKQYKLRFLAQLSLGRKDTTYLLA